MPKDLPPTRMQMAAKKHGFALSIDLSDQPLINQLSGKLVTYHSDGTFKLFLFRLWIQDNGRPLVTWSTYQQPAYFEMKPVLKSTTWQGNDTVTHLHPTLQEKIFKYLRSFEFGAVGLAHDNKVVRVFSKMEYTNKRREENDPFDIS